MGLTYSQMVPPAPALTEENLPSQKGKVFIVTGGASGVGLELTGILYRAGANVYIAGRSEDKARAAMESIRSSTCGKDSEGELNFLYIELDDLSTIKPAVNAFAAKNSKLDVLWNNAGISLPPAGSTSKQGHELTLATNCLGHYLFTQLLIPLLQAASQVSNPGAVRVVWTGSLVVDNAPKGGMEATHWEDPLTKYAQTNYTTSKLGNWFLANELARQVGKHGVLSVTQNPGNLKTALLRHLPRILAIAVQPLLYQPKMGAYTELWAGLSPDLTIDNNGCYILPWGRLHSSPRQDFLEALKHRDEGGTGRAEEFSQWCERETAAFR